MFQLIHIFLFCNTALCHIIQSFFPACSQFRVQKLSDGAVYHIKDHLSKKGWSDHLGFLIECQIFDIAQFLKNFRSGGTGSDSAAFNLGTKLFVLDQLTCILHCKNHRTGIITLWRRCLALFDTQAVHREYITFFQVLQCGKKSGITCHILSRIIPMPSNRIELAELLWEHAGKPEPVSTALYSDIDEGDTDAQKAARWAVEQDLMKDDADNNKFHPAFPVSKLRTCLTWNAAKEKGLFDKTEE